MVKSIDKELIIVDERETPYAFFRLYENDLVYILYKPGDDELDVSFAEEQMHHFKNLCKGIPKHLIVDFSDTHVSFTPEARRHFAENDDHNNLRLSHVIIVKSLAQRIVANFYMKMNKPKSPTKIAASLDQALEWIEKRSQP